MSDPAPPAPRCTVYYDGDCPICRVEIGAYRALDKGRAVDFVDVAASPDNPAADLDRGAALARFHVRLPDGRLVTGGRGFVALWRETPGLRWLGRLASLPPFIHLADPAYGLFLRIRPALQVLARGLAKEKGAPKGAPQSLDHP